MGRPRRVGCRASAIIGPGGVGLLLLAALVGGLLSFFSPCVWPLYPAYVGQVAAADGGRALRGAACFALGFSAVFLALGASASALGQSLAAYHWPLQRCSGALILLLGLAMAGLVPERLLGGPAALSWRPQGAGPGTSVLLGAAFAFGWTPCVGPVLASILLLAGDARHLGSGLLLLGAYSLGFALPFLGLATLVGRGRRVLPGLGRALPILSRAGGLLLAALGLLVLSGTLTGISTFLYNRL